MTRKVGGRKPNKAFLIVCEGAKTEPHYFRAFKSKSADVYGLGMNTRGLVEAAIKLKNESEGYDAYWCVFDRDSFLPNQFNAALSMAGSAGFEVAYSNEAFELWYLLHYDYIVSALSRMQYAGKLTNRLGRKYEKNDRTMYETLRVRLPTAIRNAEKLLASYTSHNPEKDNPSTRVHELVKLLEQHG